MKKQVVKVVSNGPGTVEIDFNAMPKHERDLMCRTVLGAVARMFEKPEVKADYELWKTDRERWKAKRQRKRKARRKE